MDASLAQRASTRPTGWRDWLRSERDRGARAWCLQDLTPSARAHLSAAYNAGHLVACPEWTFKDAGKPLDE